MIRKRGAYTSWIERIRCHACSVEQDAVVSSFKRFHRCERCGAVNNDQSWQYASIADFHQAQKQRRQGIR